MRYAHGRFQSYAEVMRFLEQNPHYPEKSRRCLSIERVKQILQHDAYTGYISKPSWGLNHIPAKHEALISFATHTRILERMAGRAHAPARKNISADFPLRQFVQCAHCERPLTASWSRGRWGKHHPYYLCQNKECGQYGKSARRADVESQFADILKAIVPVPHVFNMGTAMFRKAWNDQVNVTKGQATALIAELKKIDANVAQFLDRIVETNNRTIIKSYENRIEMLEAEKVAINEKIANSARPIVNFDDAYRTALEFLRNPCKLWDSDRLEDKRAVLKMVFGEPLKYERNVGYRTPVTTCPFRVLSGFDTQKIEVVPLDGETLNLIFNTLTDWEVILQDTSLAKGGPIPPFEPPEP